MLRLPTLYQRILCISFLKSRNSPQLNFLHQYYLQEKSLLLQVAQTKLPLVLGSGLPLKRSTGQLLSGKLETVVFVRVSFDTECIFSVVFREGDDVRVPDAIQKDWRAGGGNLDTLHDNPCLYT